MNPVLDVKDRVLHNGRQTIEHKSINIPHKFPATLNTRFQFTLQCAYTVFDEYRFNKR